MNSEQYAEKIRHTREDIDDTLHTLEDKLSPKELWEQAIKWSEGAREFSANFGRMVRENPIPATLMGISLIWFMAAGPGRRVEGVDTSGIKSRLQGKYSDVKSTIQSTTAEAGERAKSFTSDLKHRGEQLREQGQDWKGRLQAGSAELSARPVLLSAVGLALGALAAMSLPVSRREEEMFGEAGREMYRKGSEVVGEQVERGKEAATAAAEAAKEKFMGGEESEIKGEGWSPTEAKSPDDFRERPH